MKKSKTKINVLGSELEMVLVPKTDTTNFDVFVMSNKFRFVHRNTSDTHLNMFKSLFFPENEKESSNFTYTFFTTTPPSAKFPVVTENEDGTKRRKIDHLKNSNELYLVIREIVGGDSVDYNQEILHKFRFVSSPSSVLPDELLLIIFMFLEPKFLFRTFKFVNERFRKLIETEYMYQHHHMKHLFKKKRLLKELSPIGGKPAGMKWKEYVKKLSKKWNKRISVKFSDASGEEVIFRLKYYHTPLRSCVHRYCKDKGICSSSLRFSFDARTPIDLHTFETPHVLDMDDGDIVDCLAVQEGGKPVVILYSPRPDFEVESVNVRLHREHWDLHCHYPITSITNNDLNNTTSVEWRNLIVQPSGDLEYEQKKYEYLFWESQTNGTNNTDFETNGTGNPIYFVASENVVQFLGYRLRRMGLPDKEVNNMTTYWLNLLMRKRYCLLQFMSLEKYERMVDLEVVPEPEEILKIFMMFVSVDGWEDLNEERRRSVRRVRFEGEVSVVDGEREVVEQRVLGFGTKFVAVEWGGMNLVGSVFLK